MEESAQRRERLKAMRMEASQEDATYNNDRAAVSLSNPLLESTTNAEIQAQTTSQSFNYYTNPMAAYSGNKQRSQVSPQISQNYSSTPPRPRTNEAFPSPSLQPHINQPPNPQMQQPPRHYANSGYAYSSNPQQSSNFPSLQTHFTSGSGQGGYPSPHFTNSPGHGSGRGYPSPGPNFRNSPSHGSGQGGYPGSGPGPRFTNSPGHGSERGYPSPGPNFRDNPNHGSGQGGYPSSGSNQGRGYGLGFKNNMTSGPSSWRGRGSGQGRGRGNNHVSAEDRPNRFFNKSMVEDPWKFLEPVIWKPLKKQWIPYSVIAKKPRVSESPKQSSAQPSLAEILAASFNEAADDEPDAE